MTTPRPRLLFLCHTLPYPPDGGVWIRSYHLLRQLSRDFDVTGLFFERTGDADHDVDAAKEELSSHADVEVFDLPQNHSPLRPVRDHLYSIVSQRVFTVYKHRTPSFRNRLRSLLQSERFDLVHVDSLDLAAYLPTLASHPVVCGHHNVESQLLERRSQAETNPLASWYIRHQAHLQRKEEHRWCPQVDMNIVVSDNDRETLSEIAPGANTEVIPNGVDVDYFSPPQNSKDEEGLVFVGGAGWFPNRDAMDHFASYVLPRLRQRLDANLTVTWVGGAPQELRRHYQHKYGIKMPGYVDDIRPYVQRAACFVVPLRVGGGSRLKILDAWAMGKAVVSTSQGCEGLRAHDGVNILVRDEPSKFSDAIVQVLRNPDLRASLGSAARQTATECYSWNTIGDKQKRVYRSILNS